MKSNKAQEYFDTWLIRNYKPQLGGVFGLIKEFYKLPFNSQFGWKIAYMRELGYTYCSLETEQDGYGICVIKGYQKRTTIVKQGKTLEEAFNNLVEAVGNK